MVRLGEYDISSDFDGANPIDVPIDITIVHEQYEANLILNDIALIKLKNQITITGKYIKYILKYYLNIFVYNNIINYFVYILLHIIIILLRNELHINNIIYHK